MVRIPSDYEIDVCLGFLLANNIGTPKILDFLVRSYKRTELSERREKVLNQIILDLQENITSGYFFRWDFDPWDEKWDTQPHSDVPECSDGDEKWITRHAMAVKKGVLTAICAHYRECCKKTVEDISNQFNEARTHQRVIEILTIAIQSGVLEQQPSRNIGHNHNWVRSKDAFRAYENAITRVS